MYAVVVVGAEVEHDDVRVQLLHLRRRISRNQLKTSGRVEAGRDVAVDAADRLDHGARAGGADDRVARA